MDKDKDKDNVKAPAPVGGKEAELAELQKQIDALIEKREKLKAAAA
jgi:hypothetical protein